MQPPPLPRRKSPDRCRGNALVEFALILPILLLLALGVVDYGRAIQYENILTSMSREVANLSARTTALPDYIINAVASTAEPLTMAGNGMVYLTVLVGRSDGTGTVQSQSRLAGGDATLTSRIYACPAWVGTTCTVPGTAVGSGLPLLLSSGEIVRIAETAYTYTPIAGYVSNQSFVLYSQSVL